MGKLWHSHVFKQHAQEQHLILWPVHAGLCPLVAGETDIEQLGRVIATFGSIEDAWPGVKELPDYGKISFAASQGYPLEELLPDASPGSVNLLKRLLKLNPGMVCADTTDQLHHDN